MVRHAFTMIELIFAIVIMAITFITLPLILLNDSSNVERNLMQEAIFASTTKIGQILTYPWDENSPDPFATALSASNVVNVANGDNELDRNISDFRRGHIQEALHRRMTPAAASRFASTALGADAGDMDDIDDFSGNVDLDLIDSTSAEGYKKNYRVTTTVFYVPDTTDYTQQSISFTFEDNSTVMPGVQTSNIKMIQMTTDQENANGWSADPILVLRSYSANIGETDFYKRTY